MNFIEAAEINTPRILNAMEFMLNMHTKGIFLDCIGFDFERFENQTGQKLSQRTFDNDHKYLKTDYLYKEQPSIKTIFGDYSSQPIMYISGLYYGNIRGYRANLVSYDYQSNSWSIKVEDPNISIFTITHKIKPGDIYTDHIYDINDEAEMFQYSMTNKVPDFIYEVCRKLTQLIQISPHVDAITMRMDAVLLDLEYKDLETEFNLKQNSFQNF